ncbi:MAG: bifunctional methylenetetrahydrofolate dehydrogenase/methenyltetrahydrofolate cyclohydrolase, partial [Candidatus Paceibacterota bacterium]
LWADAQSAAVTIVDKSTPKPDDILRQADIIISGAGSPGLLTPDKIKEGVIIFDAGTSEEGGQLRGDADPACADKAALFTPVPGGIGP